MHSIIGRRQRHRPAVHQDLPGILPVSPEDEAGGLGASRADQPRKTQDFASFQREAYVFDGVAAAQPPHLKHRLPDFGVLFVEHVVQGAAHHQCDDAFG